MKGVSVPLSPLGNQFGRFPRRSFPEELEDSLFAPGMHVYAILDAGRIPMFDAEVLAEGQQFCCLFNGDAIAKLGASAPWLFRLHPNSRLTRQLFTPATDRRGYWDARCGVMLRSNKDLAILRGHFRRFTQIADEAGKRYFLRFYCPDALPVILDRLGPDAGRLRQWFFHHDRAVVDSYWVPDANAHRMILYHPDHASLSTVPHTRFMLDATYRAILREVRRLQKRRQIAHAVLLTEGNANDFAAEKWHRIVNESLDAAWLAGVGPERALAYVAMAGLACGRGMTADEITHILRLPASPGQQTENARRFAEDAIKLPATNHDWMIFR